MIFVSCESVDSKFAKSLIEGLRSNGINVYHSPRNPLDGEDLRWHSWYEKGLIEEISQVEILIVVITYSWDSSTWMGIESDEASRRLKNENIYFWNPENHKVTSRGMIGYLKNELPKELDEVVKVLKSKL